MIYRIVREHNTEVMADQVPAKHHALLVVMPAQGHFTPTVNLAINLASHGFAVTFFHARLVLHRLDDIELTHSGGGGQGDVFSDARAAGLDIRHEVMFTGIPLCLADAHYSSQLYDFINNKLPGHVEQLVARLRSESRPVDCLVADTSYIWPSAVAKKLDLPYVSFWTQPATVLAIYYHMDLLMANGHVASKENRKDRITYIPGVKELEPRDLMSHLQVTELTSELQSFIKTFEGAKQAEFVIGNSVRELEEEAVAVLQQKQRFYPVGPPFSGDFKSMVKTSLFPESDCLRWLDSKPPGSVLYVSFGSIAPAVNNQEIEEIAYGVLESKTSFVWVRRPEAVASSDAIGRLPEGFEEESQGKGVVVPWCNQREVLMHPSVGGFLTHCGWNSVLESIWCGVPMLCYPLISDQFTNRKLVVSDWKIGLDFGREEVLTRGKVSSSIGGLMGGDQGREAKKAIKEVQKVIGNGVADDGSSQENFKQLIGDLSEYIAVNKIKKKG